MPSPQRHCPHQVQIEDTDGSYSFLQTICKILKIDCAAGQTIRKKSQPPTNANNFIPPAGDSLWIILGNGWEPE